jgi:hypothetical protein
MGKGSCFTIDLDVLLRLESALQKQNYGDAKEILAEIFEQGEY